MKIESSKDFEIEIQNYIFGKTEGPNGTAIFVLCGQKDDRQEPVPGERFSNLEYVPYEDLFKKYLNDKTGPGYLAPPEVKIYKPKVSSSAQ